MIRGRTARFPCASTNARQRSRRSWMSPRSGRSAASLRSAIGRRCWRPAPQKRWASRGTASKGPRRAPTSGGRVLRSRAAGLASPRFSLLSLPDVARGPQSVEQQAAPIDFPCVLKPVGLSGSRGVIRANSEREYREAFQRIRALLARPQIRSSRDGLEDQILVEEYIVGREFAVEGVMTHGALTTFTVFDKPDPLVGPYFEETIYLTPSHLSSARYCAASLAKSSGRRAPSDCFTVRCTPNAGSRSRGRCTCWKWQAARSADSARGCFDFSQARRRSRRCCSATPSANPSNGSLARRPPRR